MQIPEALQHFSEPTLIVTANHVRARLWLAFEDSMEEIDSFEMPPELLSDNEAGVLNPTTGMVHTTETHREEEHRKHFARALGQHINRLIRDEQAATSLHILASHDILHALKAELAPETMQVLKKALPVDVMNEHETKILERIIAI